MVVGLRYSKVVLNLSLRGGAKSSDVKLIDVSKFNEVMLE